MKQSGKAGNFFWFIGVVTTLNCLKKMFDFYEKNLTQFIATYDSYQIAALFARFRQEEHRME